MPATDFVARARDFVACGMLITTPPAKLCYFAICKVKEKKLFSDYFKQQDTLILKEHQV